MQRSERNYPAKLLMFGEHVLLLGAPALAVPLTAFAGRWTRREEPNPYLQKMLAFAASAQLNGITGLDTTMFRSEVEQGLYFDSNIPTGYGLGSSGSFCAAVYDRYMREPANDLAVLKHQLAQMEGFFHGNSSGIDPLTSYLNAPVLIRGNAQVEQAVQTDWDQNAPIIFLLDSTLPRQSQPLIDWFLEQSKTTLFAQFLENHYLMAHQALVESWLKAKESDFWKNLRLVSQMQWEQFVPMIPSTVKEVWARSLSHQQYTLKICGAGGGGFVLGFTRNRSMLKDLESQFKLHFPLNPLDPA
jgi:mevalonate kinase